MMTVRRADAEYEATRRRMVWNERIPERLPDVIVLVTSDADVVEAVKLARARGLRISIRAGGHSWIATSLRDGGMLIDLSRLNGVTVTRRPERLPRNRRLRIPSWSPRWSNMSWPSRQGIAQRSPLAATCWLAVKAGTRVAGELHAQMF